MRPILLAAVSLLAFAPGTPVQAETTLCTEITSLPTTITTQGMYCLKRDLSTAITSGAAINVAAHNVTIDCNERKIGGLAGGSATQAYGIQSGPSTLNTTIRNCNVRGFHTGIQLGQYCGSCNSSGMLVENNLLDMNTKVGIHVEGDHSIVRGNRINSTGGSTRSGETLGIRAHGQPTLVADNIVTGTTGTSTYPDVAGIHFSGYSSIGRGNTITMTHKGAGGISAGLRGGGTTIIADGNTIANTVDALNFGIDVVYGILCRNNTVAGASNPYDGCTNGGGNYPTP